MIIRHTHHRARRLRWAWGLTLFGALALILAGCGDDEDAPNGDSSPSATPPPSETATQIGDAVQDETEPAGGETRSGGEITIHYNAFRSFDPHFSSEQADIGHQGMVFRGLYRLDAEGAVVPEMAATLPQVSDDGLTVTATLQEGLIWSDGDDLTAEDVVLGIQRTCNPDNAGEYQFVLSNLAGCDAYYAAAEVTEAEQETLREAVGARAVDELTVEFTLLAPQPSFPVILTLWPTVPAPAHIVTEPGAPWPEPTELAFNGPFVVESYSPGDSMIFARNDAYAGDHAAYLDRITFRYIEDAAVANNAYRSGELDMAQADVTNLAGLRGEFPDELVSVATASTIALQMQLAAPPLDNPDVRLALSRAIDRDTLVETVLQGAHVPTTTWVVADLLGLPGPDAYADDIGFDPAAAAEALERAGYPSGEGFPTIAILVRDSPENRLTAEFLQSEWQNHLNIAVEIDIVDGPTVGARMAEGQFELLPGGFAQDYPDPENWILGRFESDGNANIYGCSDAKLDDLIAEAAPNPDTTQRLQQYRLINEQIVTELCGIAPLFHLGDHHLISTALHGPRELSGAFNRIAAGDWSPEDWWLDK